MPQTTEALLAALSNYYRENYACQIVPRNDMSLAAQYIMHRNDDRFVLFSQAVVGKSEANDFVYVFTPDVITAENFDLCLTYAMEDASSRIDPNPNHAFSLITLLFFCDNITTDAAAKIKKTTYHKQYSAPENGWCDLRIAAMHTDLSNPLCNKMGKDVAAMLKKKLSI